MKQGEIIPITKERLIEIVSSQKFMSAIKRSKGMYNHEKAFRVCHRVYGPRHMVSKVIAGTCDSVDCSPLREQAKRILGDNSYLLIDVHYHNATLMPSGFYMNEGGDLQTQSVNRKLTRELYRIDTRPIQCIGRSTKEDDITFLFVQEKTPCILTDKQQNEVNEVVEGHYQFLHDEYAAAEELEMTGLYKAKVITINTCFGPFTSDLEKFAYFAFNPQKIENIEERLQRL